jgi:excinuclease UvrABC helicase subunit UvrB
MGIFDGLFGGSFGLDPSKFSRNIQKKDGAKLVTDTYSDPENGIYYKSSYWIYDNTESKEHSDPKILETALKEAIEKEDFETAAVLRDQLKQVKPDKTKEINELEDQIIKLTERLNKLKNG